MVTREAFDAALSLVLDSLKRSTLERLEDVAPVRRGVGLTVSSDNFE